MRNLILISLLAFLLTGCFGGKIDNPTSTHNFANGDKISLNWKVAWAKTESENPTEFVSAKVPGSVQLDIARAKNIPSYHIATNVDLYQWMEDMYYTYQTSFDKPTLAENQRLFINTNGIDYKYQILVNGKKVVAHEGIFKRFQIDITDLLKNGKNLIEVKINPVPKAFPKANFDFHSFRTNASKSAKPPVSYGWDWHPRLIPLGIWDDFNLEVRNDSNITYAALLYKMSDDLKSAKLKMLLEGNNIKNCRYHWQLLDKNGKSVMQQNGVIADNNASIDEGIFNNPNLWWTHDHGTPYLYTWEFTLSSPDGKKLQTVSEKIGFRKIRLVMNEGEWESKTTSTRVNQCNKTPMQIEPNFCKRF